MHGTPTVDPAKPLAWVRTGEEMAVAEGCVGRDRVRSAATACPKLFGSDPPYVFFEELALA